jgi:DNA polymerase III epsilon subunit-like protein
MTPCVVLDTETTGFPNNGAGHCARIIEVGAVVVTDDTRVVSQISFLVCQPRKHLESWQARKARAVHGITTNQVLSKGLPEQEAAPRLARWFGKVQKRFGVQEIRAYNQTFDFWFLEKDPWRLFERTGLVRGQDIQQVAKLAMVSKTNPRLSTAVTHANNNGGDIPWESRAHRAGEDARMAALVAIHFAQVLEASGTSEDRALAGPTLRKEGESAPDGLA